MKKLIKDHLHVPFWYTIESKDRDYRSNIDRLRNGFGTSVKSVKRLVLYRCATTTAQLCCGVVVKVQWKGRSTFNPTARVRILVTIWKKIQLHVYD